MKKILIVSHAMEIGGAEKALLGLLETIDTKKYKVDLFLLRHQGELLKDIPENINLLPAISEYSDLAVPIVNVLKKGHFRIAYGRFKAKRAAKKRVVELGLEKNDVGLEYSHKFTARYMPPISQEDYDVAISFLTPHYFVTEKVKAKKKIAWIHTDYKYVSCDIESQLSMWNHYDNIVSISDDVTKSFLFVFPSLIKKLVLIENIMPMNTFFYMAKEKIQLDRIDDNSIVLLSIGRLSYQKNFDNVPEILSIVLKSVPNVVWYIIGYGDRESEIKEQITKFNVEGKVVLLGKQVNPYPFIKKCDIYIQPSRYEGKSVAVREAQILAKPVIITDFPTARSQLEDGVDGIIVPLDNKECAIGIIEVIKKPELMKQLSENCRNRDYTNKSEINKLYDLIETS